MKNLIMMVVVLASFVVMGCSKGSLPVAEPDNATATVSDNTVKK